MKYLALEIVSVIALFSAGLIAWDAIGVARAARARRRRAQGGAYGVVVDRVGRVLGTYVDPFADPLWGARMHGADSPWARDAAAGGPVWEGFGTTAAEARRAATRLRNLYLLLPEMHADEEFPPPNGVPGSGPFA